MIDVDQLKRILEGAMLAAGEPLSLERMNRLFPENECPDAAAISTALQSIAQDCRGRGFELKEVGSGWRLQVCQDLSPWVGRLWEEKPARYSRALLETLALIAYRQPVTRGEIESVRGVSVSSNIIRTLLDREWVRVVGHRDVPGRPAMYATTRGFLDYFNLKALNELPTLEAIRDLDKINAELAFDDPPSEYCGSRRAAENTGANMRVVPDDGQETVSDEPIGLSATQETSDEPSIDPSENL